MDRNKDRHLVRRKYRMLCVGGKTIREHRYVMEKHLGRKLHKDENVHHLDGDTLNNSIENLQVIEHGRHSQITSLEKMNGAKLSKEDVLQIKKMCHDKIKQTLIARCFDVNVRTIWCITARRTWKNI